MRLPGVILPDGNTKIGEGAFVFCFALTNLSLPVTVTNIGPAAFSVCTKLSTFTIPEGIRNIESSLFKDCFGLTNVTLPNSITRIGDSAFSHTGLGSIDIPDQVSEIEHLAFEYCTNLTSIRLPNSLTYMGESVFYACVNLTNAFIPSNLTELPRNTFASSSNLTAVYFLGDAPTNDVESNVFEGADHSTIYYLPGTGGWEPTFAGRPTALWLPFVRATGTEFGVATNEFGFTIDWAEGKTIAVDTSTNLINPTWEPVYTNRLTTGSTYFHDPQWTNHTGRFYRVRSVELP